MKVNTFSRRRNILWKKFQDCNTKLTIEKFSDTLYIASADVIRLPLKCRYRTIIEVANDLSISTNETNLTELKAESLLKNTQGINATSKSLQSGEDAVFQDVSLLN